MISLEKEIKSNAPIINQENKKIDNKTFQLKLKKDTLKNINSRYKKLVLPQIQKKLSFMAAKSFTPMLKSSQSQSDLFNNKTNRANINRNITEKDQLIIAKMSLARLKTKINDISNSYKKLLYEKEENLNYLKQAISSDDQTKTENLYRKIEQILEDTIKNSENEKKEVKNNNNNENNNTDLNKNIEENNNNENKENNEENNNQNNDENKNENENNNENNENENNDEINNENNDENNNENKDENNNENIDENNNENKDENNNINNDNQDTKDNNNNINDTKAEELKNNNNLEEENNTINEINEELNKYQVESGLFTESEISAKFHNLLKAKVELSTLKLKMIKIKQIINLKEDEINDIRNKTKMKNIIFQSNLLVKNMSELHKMKTKNIQIENVSIPARNLKNENLQKELELYNKKREEVFADNKIVDEDLYKNQDEFDEKTKINNSLEKENNKLKYEKNSLKQKNNKTTMDLQILKQKVEQIDSMKELIKKQKEMITEKEYEIEGLKDKLNSKTEEFAQSTENRNNKFEEMTKYEKQLNDKIKAQRKEFNKTKNEIKDIDKSILKEVERYIKLKEDEQDLQHQMYCSHKEKNPEQFMEYIKNEELNEEMKDAKYRRECHKKFVQENNTCVYQFISKVREEREKERKRKEKEEEERKRDKDSINSKIILPLLEEKLVY